MQFTKSELKTVFPEGDTSACTIKDIVIPEIIEEIITDVTKIVDAVNNIKDDIILIIEKAKAIRDDFKSIQDIIKGIKNGSIAELDGIKSVLQKTQDIVANARTIINTIKNLVKAKATLNSNSTDGNEEFLEKTWMIFLDLFSGYGYRSSTSRYDQHHRSNRSIER